MILRSERIVTVDGSRDGELVIEAGRIEAVRERTDATDAFDLGDRAVLPGYIDLHVHGGGGAQCNTDDPDEVAAMARFHARHGTTALLATTVAAGVEELETAITAIARSTSAAGGAAVLGVHLEGPFLSRERPGQWTLQRSSILMSEPCSDCSSQATEPFGMMTLAPELPGGLDLVRALAADGIIGSLGHSEATYAETKDAVRAGARCATHTFNAMPALHQREPGLLGAVLDLDDVSCELICDGIHVHPAVLRLAYRAKGLSRATLVTDAMEAAGLPDGEYRLGAATVNVAAGRAEVAGGGSIAAAR